MYNSFITSRIEFLANQISKAVGVEITLDYTKDKDIMIDHEGGINNKVMEFFKSCKVIDIDFDEKLNWTFYTFSYK